MNRRLPQPCGDDLLPYGKQMDGAPRRAARVVCGRMRRVCRLATRGTQKLCLRIRADVRVPMHCELGMQSRQRARLGSARVVRARVLRVLRGRLGVPVAGSGTEHDRSGRNRFGECRSGNAPSGTLAQLLGLRGQLASVA